MLKAYSLKFFTLVILLSIGSSFAHADSALFQLPFGIKIGQTTNKEIENKGVCIKKIQVSDGYFRCEYYTMSGGKFFVESTEGEIVSGVLFQTGNTLPQKWKELGLRLADKNTIYDNETYIPGNSDQEFINILTTEKAENIVRTVKNNRSGEYNYGAVYVTISFDLNAHHYDAIFYTYSGIASADFGLISIKITEAY